MACEPAQFYQLARNYTPEAILTIKPRAEPGDAPTFSHMGKYHPRRRLCVIEGF
jgi:hypothetical protein